MHVIISMESFGHLLITKLFDSLVPKTYFLFFSDARRLGCCAQSVSCADGLSWASLEKGLRLYREKGRARSIMAKHFVKK